jgi:hypothetical protein
VTCIERAYQTVDLQCVLVNDLCRTYDSFNGHCTGCYAGFSLDSNTGECLKSASASCLKFEANSSKCIECITRYYLDGQSQCQAIGPNCEIFNSSSRTCQQCYKGFQLNANNTCVEVVVITSAVVENCVTYDSTGQICVACYSRYYLQSNKCFESDPLCKSFEKIGGGCTSCYNLFKLDSNKKCIYQG